MIDLIFFTVLIIFCLYGVYYFYKQGIMQLIGFVRILKSKKWQIVKGKVINAEYKFLKYKETVSSAPDYKDRTRIDFVLKKTYTYTLNGITYESSQGLAADSLLWGQFKSISDLPKKKNIIFYEENPKTKQLEKGRLNASLYIYNKNILQEKANSIIGEEVQVYFNPRNPKKSCLSIQIDNLTMILMILSVIVMLVLGTMSAYMSYFIGKDYLIKSINIINNN